MTEITRVPLQPIAGGSISKIWLGVAVAALIGLGTAYATRYEGLSVVTEKAGTGPMPTAADVVLVNYTGHLANGKEFDRGEKVAIPLDAVVPCFSKGLQKMQKGGKYRLHCPAKEAYGAEPQVNRQSGQTIIPANSDLNFDLELLDFMNAAQLRQMQQMQMQQLQQMQGARNAPGGAPGAAPGAPPAP